MKEEDGKNSSGVPGSTAPSPTAPGQGDNRVGLKPAQIMGRGPGHGMGQPVERAKNFKGSLRRLVAFLRPYRISIFIVFGLAVLSTAFSVAGPKILGLTINLLIHDVQAVANHSPGAVMEYGRVASILLILLALYLLSAAFSYATQLVMARVSQKTVYAFRRAIDEKLERLPLSFFDNRPHGDVLSRVTNDVDTIANTLQQSLVQVITSIVTLVGSVAMMFSISWKLSLVAIATLPLYVVATTWVTKRSQGYFKGQQKYLGLLSGHVEEMYSGHPVVKAFGYEGKSVRRFNGINDQLYDVAWKAQFVSSIIMPVMTFINNIGYVLIAAIGGFMAAHKTITLGDIQAFIQYARQFTQPIIQTANMANILQSTVAAAERVFEILDETEESAESVSPPETLRDFLSSPGPVTFNSISFSYTKDRPLIQNLSLNVPAGQTVAIVGPTGAGKTTLVNLLMRFYEIDGGSIQVNGVNIRDLPRGILRRSFGMVLQDTWLFGGTIRENIAYGREGATEAEIVAAAVAAQADHFIRVLPQGYDTILNEEASNLSQGQRQLLTIARAFLADPRILILDEATSSVDTRTEVIVRQAMVKLMEGRTSFVIAHRLSTIRDAHTILVMNGGAIVEQGNHQNLLAARGFYADLYQSQFLGIGDPAIA